MSSSYGGRAGGSNDWNRGFPIRTNPSHQKVQNTFADQSYSNNGSMNYRLRNPYGCVSSKNRQVPATVQRSIQSNERRKSLGNEYDEDPDPFASDPFGGSDEFGAIFGDSPTDPFGEFEEETSGDPFVDPRTRYAGIENKNKHNNIQSGRATEQQQQLLRLGGTNLPRRPVVKMPAPMKPPTCGMEPCLTKNCRTSQRFQHYQQQQQQQGRTADICLKAKVVKGNRYKQGDEGLHVLICPSCRNFLKLPKLSVLMKCPTCSTVSSAASTSNQ